MGDEEKKEKTVERNTMSTKTCCNLDSLWELPHKMVNYHEAESLKHMILHEFGHHDLLGQKQATFLVDNPDFNCIHGIAGFSHEDCNHHKNDMWSDPYSFSKDMQGAPFHNTIQQLNSIPHESIIKKNNGKIDEKAYDELCERLGMKNTSFIHWKMKHGNHGILLFEDAEKEKTGQQKTLLHNLVALLSLC